MAIWTDLADRAYKQVLSSEFVNQVLGNVRWLREQITDNRAPLVQKDGADGIVTSGTTGVALLPTQTFELSEPRWVRVSYRVEGTVPANTWASWRVWAAVDGSPGPRWQGQCDGKASGLVAGSRATAHMTYVKQLPAGPHTLTLTMLKEVGDAEVTTGLPSVTVTYV